MCFILVSVTTTVKMRVLLIVVLTLGWTHGATVWNRTNERSVCTFNIKKIDHAMVMKDGQVLQPVKGTITLNPGDKIALVCSENSNLQTALVCKSAENFQMLNKQIININQLTCATETKPELKRDKCLGTKSLIQIGFKQANSTVEQMEVCFDDTTKQTLYVKAIISKGIDDKESQSGVKRPPFRKDGTFIKDSLDAMYTNQAATFKKLLNRELSERVNTGHLVAWADFSYSVQRRLTMFYVNTAPQWVDFNNGNWEKLESTIRSAIVYKDYDVYTGTYGILELPDSKNKMVKMYLDPTNKKYPVPKYFWKVLIEKTSANKKGVAFIGRNNVLTPVSTGEAKPCKNVITTMPWLNNYADWGKLEKGQMIACEVGSFKALWKDQLPDFPPVPGGLPKGKEL